MLKGVLVYLSVSLVCCGGARASVVLNNNDDTGTSTKTWTVSDLNDAPPSISAADAVLTGLLTDAGSFGASESFSLIASGVIGWNQTAAEPHVSGGTLTNYLAGLAIGLVDGLGTGELGVDSTSVYSGDSDNSLGKGSREALVYTVDAGDLAPNTSVVLERVSFQIYGAGDYADFMIWDVSANEAITAQWNQDYKSTDDVSGSWALEDGDLIIVGAGESMGVDDHFRVDLLTLDVVSNAPPLTPPTVGFMTPANDLTNFPAGQSLFVEGTATDNDSITNVTLAINGVTVGSDPSAPYRWGGTTDENDAGQLLGNLTDGTYTLRLTAYDNEGATNQAHRTVTVVTPSPYESWAGGFSLTGDDALMSANPDWGELNNLFEFAFGGNPTNSADDAGLKPKTKVVLTNGASCLEYSFNRRKNAAELGLDYNVEHGDFLQPESWGAYAGNLDVDSVDADFDLVTARIKIPSRVSNRFFRLNINSGSVYTGPVDVGILRNAADFDGESNPVDTHVVRRLADGAVGDIRDGSWIVFSDFLFGSGASEVAFEASSEGGGGTVELRLDAPDGALMGSVDISATGGWDTYQAFSNSHGAVSGMHDLYLVFVSDGAPATENLFNLKTILLESAKPEVVYNPAVPQLAFAARELEVAFEETGAENLLITLTIEPDAASPESYEIRVVGANQIEIVGADATGAMYGGIEAAEFLKLGLPIQAADRAPLVPKRGLKLNLPLDARCPSYSDRGDAAQQNIANVWEVDFWKAYIDGMARYRYNVLSLWTTHPYPNLVEVPGYEDCAMEDVFRVAESELDMSVNSKLIPTLDLDGDGNVEEIEGGVTNHMIQLVKRLTMAEKVAHWQEVFQYAEERGIEVYLFHWDVYVNGAIGKYGITEDQANTNTVAYARASVKEALLTYPNLKGIGVCSGEHDRDTLDYTADSTENYMYKTYGRGIMDARADARWDGRDVRFIYRRHGVPDENPDAIKEVFFNRTDGQPNYTGGIMDSSTKYSVAHMYASRRPQEWEDRIIDTGFLSSGFKVWLNLRNDDIFMHRWGSADFAREFIRNMPHGDIPGFYMGSDGYFWGREFMAKSPSSPREMEISKHWYNFRLFGELAYNNDLDDAYWKKVLEHRFDLSASDGALLFNAWQGVSEIVPQLNRSVWSATDGNFASEMCQGDNFLDYQNYYFERNPMIRTRIPHHPSEPLCISVTDWAEDIVAGDTPDPTRLTPLQVADNLESWATNALAALPTLEARIGGNAELENTLRDIRSMAYLGQYYADKQRAAANLKLFLTGGAAFASKHPEAVAHIHDAKDHWVQYSDTLNLQYNHTLHSKTGYFNWEATYAEVLGEVDRIEQLGDLPTPEFPNITDGQAFGTADDLNVDIDVKGGPDGDLAEVKLYINGLRVDGRTGSGRSYNWNYARDELLENMDQDWYSLKAVVVNTSGFVTENEIYVNVNAAPGTTTVAKEDWKDEKYALIHDHPHIFESGRTDLPDGEEVKIDGDEWAAGDNIYGASLAEAVFADRLDVKFTFDSSGKVKLRDLFLGINVHKTRSKEDEGRKSCDMNADGAIYVWNEAAPRSIIWSSRVWDSETQSFKNSAPIDNGFTGPFEFIVTRGKKLAVTGMKNGTRQTAWSQNPDYRDFIGRIQ